MPRRSGGGGGGGRAPSRPTVPARKPAAPNAQQTRPSSTTAGPAPGQQGQQQGQQASGGGSGLFGQMASTAAGVAVGSSIGHAIGGFFGGGGGSSGSAEQAPGSQDSFQQQGGNDTGAYNSNNQAWGNSGSGNCQEATQNFTKCMDEQQGNMSICNWYLEQLKACQQAAKQY